MHSCAHVTKTLFPIFLSSVNNDSTPDDTQSMSGEEKQGVNMCLFILSPE